MALPLEGIRILDFTVFQQGPVGTTLLADLGAEVIKVEAPEGELGRRLRADRRGFSPFFEAHNRGKRSLTVDLKSPAGLEIVRRLLPSCDVLTHNFRPGVMEKLGLGYNDVRALRVDIVYVGASGYGDRGPMAGYPAFDGTGQALSGLMTVQSAGKGERPLPAMYGLADSLGGSMLANAVMAGLVARSTTGAGQRMHVSIVGSLLFVQAVEVVESLYQGIQNRMRYRLNPTFGPFECRDGNWFVLATVSPAHWPRICGIIKRPDLTDGEFAKSRWRYTHADEVEELLEREFLKGDRDDWVAAFTEAEIPCAPVLEYAEIAEHEQMLANGYIRTVTHELAGELKVIGTPIQVNDEQPELRNAPRLGADNGVLLTELGFSESEIVDLRRQQVI